jgi:putative acetyltransferase
MLTTHASVTAKPFFEKHGFEVQDEQIVSIAGVQMNNFRMQKMLQ